MALHSLQHCGVVIWVKTSFVLGVLRMAGIGTGGFLPAAKDQLRL